MGGEAREQREEAAGRRGDGAGVDGRGASDSQQIAPKRSDAQPVAVVGVGVAAADVGAADVGAADVGAAGAARRRAVVVGRRERALGRSRPSSGAVSEGVALRQHRRVPLLLLLLHVLLGALPPLRRRTLLVLVLVLLHVHVHLHVLLLWIDALAAAVRDLSLIHI